MSHNLCLIADKHRQLDLWQTPTAATERIAFSGNPKAGYFAWLDQQAEAQKPPDHGRCDKRTRARLTSTEEYRAKVREHLDILVDAMQKDLTSADRFLTCLAGGGGFEVLRQELDRLKLGKKA